MSQNENDFITKTLVAEEEERVERSLQFFIEDQLDKTQEIGPFCVTAGWGKNKSLIYRIPDIVDHRPSYLIASRFGFFKLNYYSYIGFEDGQFLQEADGEKVREYRWNDLSGRDVYPFHKRILEASLGNRLAGLSLRVTPEKRPDGIYPVISFIEVAGRTHYGNYQNGHWSLEKVDTNPEGEWVRKMREINHTAFEELLTKRMQKLAPVDNIVYQHTDVKKPKNDE